MDGANTSDGFVELPEFLPVEPVGLSLGEEEPRGVLEFSFLVSGEAVGLSLQEELPVLLGEPSITSTRQQLDEAPLVVVVGGGGRLPLNSVQDEDVLEAAVGGVAPRIHVVVGGEQLRALLELLAPLATASRRGGGVRWCTER